MQAKLFVHDLLSKYNPETVKPNIGSDGLFHFLYITYHNLSFKFYIGKHTTNNLDDGYLGSGQHFKHALKKHGSQSFSHARLFFVSSEDEAFEHEANLVNEDFIKKYREELDVCYNLKAGGRGGSAYLSQETRDKMSQSLKETMARPEVKAKMSQSLKEACARPEVKARRSQASKEANARPEVKAKKKETMARPEVKARRSQAIKEACARPEVKAKRSQSLKETMALKELVHPSTGETKEVHWKEMKPELEKGWELTSKIICLYNPKDNNRRTRVAFERTDINVDKVKAHERLIKLLGEGWQVGYPPAIRPQTQDQSGLYEFLESIKGRYN